MIVHASLIARRIAGYWRGVLILGPSGSGKSDLALRSLGAGFRLVADDQVVLFASGGRLYGRAPDPLAGLIEIRGQGVHRADALPFARITLTARLAPDPKTVDRWPDPESVSWLSVATPVLQVWPFEPAATVKLCSAMEFLGCSAE